jgi:inorganic pyrophosphatase
MADDKGSDDKILCVPVSDPNWNKLEDLSDMNPHLLKEIEHFFQVYKDLENKKVDVGGWGDVHKANQIIDECIERFEKIENKTYGLFSIK